MFGLLWAAAPPAAAAAKASVATVQTVQRIFGIGRMTTPVKAKRSRVDGQMTGVAGELFVAAELMKRGLQTSITFGNAKAVDLLTFNAATGRTFTVQVKALRKRSDFPISHRRVSAQHVYVFVVLNKPGEQVRYYVVPGQVLAADPDRFGKWFVDDRFPGVHPRFLEDFAENWSLFDANNF